MMRFAETKFGPGRYFRVASENNMGNLLPSNLASTMEDLWLPSSLQTQGNQGYLAH
jgi:hypothetical protein